MASLIDNIKKVAHAAAERLQPIVKAAKIAFAEYCETAISYFQTLKSVLGFGKSTVKVATAIAKAAGNSSKAVFYDLPVAAYAKYQNNDKESAAALNNAVIDISEAGHQVCETAQSTVETASAALELIQEGAGACAHTAKSVYYTGAFVAEIGKLAYEGAQTVAPVMCDAASLAYSYTPSYQDVKAHIAAIAPEVSRNSVVSKCEEIELTERRSLLAAAPAA